MLATAGVRYATQPKVVVDAAFALPQLVSDGIAHALQILPPSQEAL